MKYYLNAFLRIRLHEKCFKQVSFGLEGRGGRGGGKRERARRG